MKLRIKRPRRQIGGAPLPASDSSPYRNPNVGRPLPERGLISPAHHQIVQLEITNRCFMNCSNCTRLVGHQTKAFEMDRRTFCRAVESVADHPGMVGIMGGEPTMHPDFPWLVGHYAHVIDAGRKYSLCRPPIEDLAAYRLTHASSLHHRRGIWSATGPHFRRHLELIADTFGYWCLNDHSHSGQHQALLIARRDWGVPDDVWEELRDSCWIQRTWSSSVTPAGAYFCEVAAAIDWTLFDGQHAWPIEPGWWQRTPADFGAQLSLCEYCAAPLRTPARLPAEQCDDLSPTMYQLLKTRQSPRVKAGRVCVHVAPQTPAAGSEFGVETYMRQADGSVDNAARIAPDNRWIRPKSIVGVLVCVDFSEWLADVLRQARPQLDDLVVVTTPADTATQKIATAAACRLVISDACYAGGDAFNKGRLLNAGLEAAKPKDWVLFFDADVLLPPHWGQWLRSRGLNPGVLYHARRTHAYSPRRWEKVIADWQVAQKCTIREQAADLLPFGFHQLWNVRASAVAGRGRAGVPMVSEAFPTAATVDYHFYRLWQPDKRVRLPDEMSIVHRWHGDFAARWHNRGIHPGQWRWIGQVSPIGPMWFLAGMEPAWPATLKVIDLDTETYEIVDFPDRAALDRYIGARVVDVYRKEPE